MTSLAPPHAIAGGTVETILAEGPLGMSGVARLCGSYRAGKPTHPSTCTRWAVNGIRLADGRLLKLEAVRLNGRLVSSRAALIRFIAAQQTDAPAPDTSSAPALTARRRASDAAGDKLKRMGC